MWKYIIEDKRYQVRQCVLGVCALWCRSLVGLHIAAHHLVEPVGSCIFCVKQPDDDRNPALQIRGMELVRVQHLSGRKGVKNELHYVNCFHLWNGPKIHTEDKKSIYFRISTAAVLTMCVMEPVWWHQPSLDYSLSPSFSKHCHLLEHHKKFAYW